MFKSTRTQTLKDYDFKISNPKHFFSSCLWFSVRVASYLQSNASARGGLILPFREREDDPTLDTLENFFFFFYPLPLVNICPLRAESPFKSLIRHQLLSVSVVSVSLWGPKLKVNGGQRAKRKHLLCFIVIMQNGAGVTRLWNWLTSSTKKRKVLNDNKGYESIFITHKIKTA